MLPELLLMLPEWLLMLPALLLVAPPNVLLLLICVLLTLRGCVVAAGLLCVLPVLRDSPNEPALRLLRSVTASRDTLPVLCLAGVVVVVVFVAVVPRCFSSVPAALFTLPSNFLVLMEPPVRLPPNVP